MSKITSITANDPILNTLHFRRYITLEERCFSPFQPQVNESQTLDITTPWGETLTATAGDLIVHEADSANDCWPVKADIFEDTYIVTRPGHCRKRAVTMLAPLTELTSDENAEVTVHTLEGQYTVRAGDFFLARGVKGEIWAYPKDKAESLLALAEE